MKKRLLRRRQWLRPNKGWGTQSTIHTDCEVFDNSWVTKRKTIQYSIEASLHLRDCSNHISFSFEADNDKHWYAQLRAMEKLKKELELLIEAWGDAASIVSTSGGWKEEKK